MNAYIDRTFSPKQYGDTREARDQATRQRERQKQDAQHDKRMDKNDTKATFFPDERKCTSHHTLYYLPWAAYDAMCRRRRCRRRRRHLSHASECAKFWLSILLPAIPGKIPFYFKFNSLVIHLNFGSRVCIWRTLCCCDVQMRYLNYSKVKWPSLINFYYRSNNSLASQIFIWISEIKMLIAINTYLGTISNLKSAR